ncbi:MAG: 2-succinyl-5-enolpyruvyl-6-hydroxy-3-cyclohexene-1-carboxylic-acid synthase [Thermodesulfobacteriota bacterium]
MAPALLCENMSVLWASVVVEELVRNGLSTFFVSPGNRNAPLMAALLANPRAAAVSVLDERGAGYRALGHGKATGRPAVLVCTSGTALANYFPAVIEAFRDEIALVVLSADRPPEMVGADANQTMAQPDIFGHYVLQTLSLPAPDPRHSLDALAARIDSLAQVKNGPVHINCPFRDPLLPLADPGYPVPPEVLAEAEAFFGRTGPRTRYARVSCACPDLEEVRGIIGSTRRGLLSLGRMAGPEDRAAAAELALRFSWPVVCDVASSLRSTIPPALQLPSPDHPGIRELLQDYGPDTVLQLGTGFVSKHYYGMLSRGAAGEVILVSERQGTRDPSFAVSLRVPAPAAVFVRSLGAVDSPSHDRDAAATLLSSVKRLVNTLEDAVPADQLSFPIVARTVNRMIPAGEALFLGNSNAIRAFDAEAPPAASPVHVVSNRGVSGIEGNVATALGFAEGSGRRVTAVVGDVSLLHDMGSLLLMSQSAAPVILMVVNNQGGRIFEKLPAAGFPEIRNTLMATPHAMDFSHACRQFGLSYARAESPEELRRAYREALAGGKTVMIEVRLDPETDLRVHERLNRISK